MVLPLIINLITYEIELCSVDPCMHHIILVYTNRNSLFTEEVVYDRLSKLDSGKSVGPDGLHPHLLKECGSSIAKPLASIFQESLSQGQIPSDWKLANVLSYFQEGIKELGEQL